MVHGLVGNTYEEKLEEIGLSTLENRRKRIDLIQTFKIINGIDDVDPSVWFNLVGNDDARVTRTTSYNRNIHGNQSSTEVRRNFFSNRVVNSWNNLPSDVKDARSV